MELSVYLETINAQLIGWMAASDYLLTSRQSYAQFKQANVDYMQLMPIYAIPMQLHMRGTDNYRL